MRTRSPKERLYTCPVCKQPGFILKGLKAHRCPEKPKRRLTPTGPLQRPPLTPSEIERAVVEATQVQPRSKHRKSPIQHFKPGDKVVGRAGFGQRGTVRGTFVHRSGEFATVNERNDRTDEGGVLVPIKHLRRDDPNA